MEFKIGSSVAYLDTDTGKAWWVDKLYVADGERRQGIGKKLMQLVCDHADRHNKALELFAIATRTTEGALHSARLVEWYRDNFDFHVTKRCGSAADMRRDARRGRYERLWARSDYVAGVVGHDLYYASMALRGGLARGQAHIQAPWVYALAIGDKALNSIDRDVWDRTAHWCSEGIRAGMPPDETDSPCTRVCALKALARVVAQGKVDGLLKWEDGMRPIFAS